MSILDKIKDLFGVSNNPETVVKKVTAHVEKVEKKIKSTPKKVHTPKNAKTKARGLIKKAKKK
jgi:hypothetical protein